MAETEQWRANQPSDLGLLPKGDPDAGLAPANVPAESTGKQNRRFDLPTAQEAEVESVWPCFTPEPSNKILESIFPQYKSLWIINPWLNYAKTATNIPNKMVAIISGLSCFSSLFVNIFKVID